MMRCGSDRNDAVLRHERCCLSLMMEGTVFGKDRGCKEVEMVIVREGQIAKRFSGLFFTQLLNGFAPEQSQRRTR